MISFKIKKPYCICLFLTFRCNASCVNCCNGCRPDFGRTMTTEQMKQYVDICLESYPDSITRLALSGGECFLLGSDLDEIVRYGASKGLSVDVISNGSWGKSYKSACERIKGLKDIGLQAITFSVGEDHSRECPCRLQGVSPDSGQYVVRQSDIQEAEEGHRFHAIGGKQKN